MLEPGNIERTTARHLVTSAGNEFSAATVGYGVKRLTRREPAALFGEFTGTLAAIRIRTGEAVQVETSLLVNDTVPPTITTRQRRTRSGL